MSIKHKWLRAILLVMVACAGAFRPKDIQDLLHIMNETKVEFTIPDDDSSGDSGPGGYRSLIETQETPPKAPLSTSQ